MTNPSDCTPTSPDVDGNLESYFTGTKKPWTIDMALRQCRNIRYLQTKQDELFNSINPEFRSPEQITIDENASYGIVLDEGDGQYEMGHAITDGFTDFLTDARYIDPFLTTAVLNGNTGHITLPQTNNIGSSTIDIDNMTDSANHLYTRHCDVWFQLGPGVHFYSDSFQPDVFQPGVDNKIIAQIFTAGATGYLDKLVIKTSTPTGAAVWSEMWVEIQTVSAGKPSGTAIYREKVNYTGVIIPQNPPILTSGTTYALVIRADPTNILLSASGTSGHLLIGGYSDVNPSTKLANSQVWYSDDNGDNWYIKAVETNTKAYTGKDMAVRDIQFQTYVRALDASPYPTTSRVVYWKPYKTKGPITEVTLDPSFTLNSQTIKWEVSSDFITWHEVTSAGSWTHTFTGGELGKYNIYVRATLTSSSNSQTPEISGLEVTVQLSDALEGYILSKFYDAIPGKVQGGNIWSRVGVDMELSPENGQEDATIEIVRGTPTVERFTFGAADTTFTLQYYPSEPLIHVRHIASNGAVTDYTENKEYTTDYSTGANAKEGVFTTAPGAGTIEVTYYPLLLKDLSPSDFQDEDENYVGLKIDVISESFTATAGQTIVTLQTQAVNPLSRVEVNNIVLIEGADYTVEYLDTSDATKPPLSIITFLSALELDDIIEVNYSPKLDDLSLAIAYRVSRVSNTEQVYVKPWWFQVKT